MLADMLCMCMFKTQLGEKQSEAANMLLLEYLSVFARRVVKQTDSSLAFSSNLFPALVS